jgi:hypothetical protein
VFAHQGAPFADGGVQLIERLPGDLHPTFLAVEAQGEVDGVGLIGGCPEEFEARQERESTDMADDGSDLLDRGEGRERLVNLPGEAEFAADFVGQIEGEEFVEDSAAEAGEGGSLEDLREVFLGVGRGGVFVTAAGVDLREPEFCRFLPLYCGTLSRRIP